MPQRITSNWKNPHLVLSVLQFTSPPSNFEGMLEVESLTLCECYEDCFKIFYYDTWVVKLVLFAGVFFGDAPFLDLTFQFHCFLFYLCFYCLTFILFSRHAFLSSFALPYVPVFGFYFLQQIRAALYSSVMIKFATAWSTSNAPTSLQILFYDIHAP